MLPMRRAFNERRNSGRNNNQKLSHRYDLPLVLTDELDTEDEPLILAAPLGRGFLLALFSICSLGAASFITIFAWISSSLLALTFFGQKRVTKLDHNSLNFHGVSKLESSTHVQRCRRHLSLSSPTASFAFKTSSIRRPIAASESLRMATLSSRGMSSPESFSCFCAILCQYPLNIDYNVSY